MTRNHDVDLMVIRALHDGIDRHRGAPAGAQHAAELGQAPQGVRKKHQAKVTQDCVEAAIRKRECLPILDRHEDIRRVAETRPRYVGHLWRNIRSRNMPG